MSRVVGAKLGGSTFPKKDLYGGFSQARDYLINLQKEGNYPVAIVSAPEGMSDVVLDAERWLVDHEFESKIPIVVKAAEAASGSKERFVKGIKNGIMGLYSGEIQKLGSYGGRLLDEMEEEVEKLRVYLLEDGNDQVRKALPENHSGRWLSGMLRDVGIESVYLDGMEVGIVASSRGMVKRAVSSMQIQESLKNRVGPGRTPVVGGYIGRRIDTGEPIILGRNTTDVSGAVVSVGLGAREYQIIKDAPGVYRIEPKITINGNTIEIKTDVIPFMSYNESCQIAIRGSKVVHPSAIDIAEDADLPIRVKSLGGEKGTLISRKSITTPENPVAAISTGLFYLLSVNDSAMSVPEESRGYGSLVTRIIADSGASYADTATPAKVMSFAVYSSYDGKKVDIEKVKKNLEVCLGEYGYEPRYVGYRDVAGMSLTGDAMRGTPGMIARTSGILAKEGISISMQSQSDEKVGPTVINYYVESGDFERAVRALCRELF
ncbi:MAG: hypothetical protein NTY20_03525 [Candidatus Aenigmarchaeota archaeon]|nr:hypothetical protein [Candidatus Aenigmarchaeota archaeon]